MSPAHQGAPGHEGYLNDKVVTIPQLLQDAGYFTCMAGKWHMGLRKKHWPDKKGFRKSYALLPGAANHYGWEPEYENPHESLGFIDAANAAPHVENGEPVQIPKEFYSSDYYADKIIEYLEERNAEAQDKPFYAYLPFSAPHWPLQAPRECVEQYHGRYANGPAALRLERLAALKDAGLIPADVIPHEVIAVQGEQPEWDKLSPDEQAKSARAMETYAAMVTRMDENVGKIVEYLKRSGEYDNTFILFMSDNGAEGSSIEAHPVAGPRVSEHINKYFDNSFDNIGRANSWVYYGTRWAQAATAPSRLHKLFSTEGGCRVPLVFKPPRQFSVKEPSAITDAFCTVLDLAPTLLEAAGLRHPGKQYRGRGVHPVDATARSWIQFLQHPSVRAAKTPAQTSFYAIHPEDEPHGFEMAGSGAMRQGQYKITFVPRPKGPEVWQLYDIIADPGEVHDLKDEEPELFEKLHDLWLEYKKRVGVIGVTGEFDPKRVHVEDEFEDDVRWVRSIGSMGNNDLPARFYE